MTATAKQIAAGAAAIRAADARHSPEEVAEAVFKAMNAETGSTHEEKVAELDEQIADQNAESAAAHEALKAEEAKPKHASKKVSK